MSAADYALGVALVGAVVGSLAYGAVRIRARLLPAWVGAPARLAEIILGLAALIVVPELLGTVGLFERWPVAVALVAVGLIAGTVWGRPPVPRPPPDGSTPPDTTGRIAIIGSLVVAGVVLARWSAHVVAAFRDGIWDGDSLWYHLPFAARFVQDGSVVHPMFTDGDTVVTYFPANAEIVHGLTILPFGNDFLVPLVNIGWVAIAMLAAWCIGARFGARAIALGAVSIVMSIEVMTVTQAGTARNDVVAIALLLSTVALVMHAEWSKAAIAVAGLAAGLTLGVKLSVVVIAGLLVIGVVVVAPRAARRSLLLPWLLPSLGIGAFWYLRNLVVVGNPLPWVGIDVGPISLPSPLIAPTAETAVFDRLTEADGWSTVIYPGLKDVSPVWWLLALLVVAGITGALIRGDRTTRMLGAISTIAIVVYVFMPNGVPGTGALGAQIFAFNTRYVLPAVTLALILLAAWPVLRRAPAAVAYVAVSAGVVGVQLGADRFGDEWQWLVSGDDQVVGVVLVLLAAVAGAVGWLLRGRRRALLALAAAIAVGVVLVGAALRDVARDDRYREARADEPSSAAWPWARDLPPSTIAIIGDFFQYPFTGRDLEHEVRYAGVELDNGGFREPRTCRELRKFLADENAEYVVIAPQFFLRGADFLEKPRQWVRSMPGTSIAFRGDAATVFSITTTPDPDDCP